MVASTTAADHREQALIEQCLEHMRGLPFVRSVQLGAKPLARSGHLRLRTLTQQHLLPFEVKGGHLRKETAQLLIHLAQKQPDLVVFAALVGSELGNLFEHAGVNFIDAAGNCNFRIGNQYIARIQGRSPIDRVRTGRGLRAAAYRALLAVLIRPELIDAPSRTIASEASVSPQTANELRRRLVEQKIALHTNGHHHWVPGRQKDALGLWVAGYAATLAPSLLIGRFRARERDVSKLEAGIEPTLDEACEWRYGGGAAAHQLTEYFRGERTLIYVLDPPADLSARLHLVRDSAGPIVLARSPGQLAFVSPHPRSVHPIVAYADLLAEGEPRALEAAGEIHARFLSVDEPGP